MTLTRPTSTFGAGGSEPYARALRSPGSSMLYPRSRDGRHTHAPGMDVSRWNARADAADLSLLHSVTGPVLDIGCGPGRMVRAATDLGMVALGVDVSSTAVQIAMDAGLNVVRGSVFDALPAEGSWQTVLLVDGNIGIGGDVSGMLARCRELLAPAGEIVVEVQDDPSVDSMFIGSVVDAHGDESAPFPWAQVGLDGLIRRARRLGLKPRQSWTIDSRTFCRLAATAR